MIHLFEEFVNKETPFGKRKVLKLKKGDPVIWNDDKGEHKGIFYEYRTTTYFIYVPKVEAYAMVSYKNETIKLDELKIATKKYNL